jgi:hypothetical protein
VRNQFLKLCLVFMEHIYINKYIYICNVYTENNFETEDRMQIKGRNSFDIATILSFPENNLLN